MNNIKENNQEENRIEQSEGIVYDKNGEASIAVSEANDENRAKPIFDERKINDDINEYIFLKPAKKKKVRTTDAPSLEHEDTPVVKSERQSAADRKKKKKHRNSSKKKMKLWKKMLISVVSVLLGFSILICGVAAFLWYRGEKQLMPNQDFYITAPVDVITQNHGEYVVYNGKTYKYNSKVTSVLFMGVDNRDMQTSDIIGTSGQSDVNVLMAVDTDSGKISLINMSRDIMTEINEYSASGTYVRMSTMHLCLAYSFGDGKETSCENQVNAVERLFYNIPINSYYALDLNGIAAINDSVGGVDVVSPNTIGEWFIEGQSYHLEGEQAEYFVRMRDENAVDANNERMKRQQVYIQSFASKILSQTKEDISTPLDLYNAAAQYSCTNINPAKIMYLAGVAVSNRNMSIEMLNVPGEVKMGEKYAEFYVDEDAFYEMFLSIFYTPID